MSQYIIIHLGRLLAIEEEPAPHIHSTHAQPLPDDAENTSRFLNSLPVD